MIRGRLAFVLHTGGLARGPHRKVATCQRFLVPRVPRPYCLLARYEVPVWETGATGPFDHWPTYQGFEKFYGFVSG